MYNTNCETCSFPSTTITLALAGGVKVTLLLQLSQLGLATVAPPWGAHLANQSGFAPIPYLPPEKAELGFF